MQQKIAVTYEDVKSFFQNLYSNADLTDKTNPTDPDEPTTCLYQDGKGNHCLVGHWLHNEMGIDDEWMACFIEGKAADEAVRIAAEYHLLPPLEPKAVELLSDIQHLADDFEVADDGEEWERFRWGSVLEELGIVKYRGYYS